mgnify:CR=1
MLNNLVRFWKPDKVLKFSRTHLFYLFAKSGMRDAVNLFILNSSKMVSWQAMPSGSRFLTVCIQFEGHP